MNAHVAQRQVPGVDLDVLRRRAGPRHPHGPVAVAHRDPGRLLLAIGAWLLNEYQPSWLAHAAFQTALALAVSHGVFRVVAVERVKDSKTRYTLRKALTVALRVVSQTLVISQHINRAP